MDITCISITLKINIALVVMIEVLFLMGNIKGKEARESNVLMMYYNTWFP
jgi:hypothetical protein